MWKLFIDYVSSSPCCAGTRKGEEISVEELLKQSQFKLNETEAALKVLTKKQEVSLSIIKNMGEKLTTPSQQKILELEDQIRRLQDANGQLTELQTPMDGVMTSWAVDKLTAYSGSFKSTFIEMVKLKDRESPRSDWLSSPIEETCPETINFLNRNLGVEDIHAQNIGEIKSKMSEFLINMNNQGCFEMIQTAVNSV